MNIEVYFWVSPWSHKPTRLMANVEIGESGLKFTLDVTYNAGKPSITAPSGSIGLTEIIEWLTSESYDN
jgi:hypothetical protein